MLYNNSISRMMSTSPPVPPRFCPEIYLSLFFLLSRISLLLLLSPQYKLAIATFKKKFHPFSFPFPDLFKGGGPLETRPLPRPKIPLIISTGGKPRDRSIFELEMLTLFFSRNNYKKKFNCACASEHGVTT